MRNLQDWINHVNENVSNMSAVIVGDVITVRLYGYHAVDMSAYFESVGKYSMADILEYYDIDLLTIELDDGALGTVINGADPYGLIAYIKAAY